MTNREEAGELGRQRGEKRPRNTEVFSSPVAGSSNIIIGGKCIANDTVLSALNYPLQEDREEEREDQSEEEESSESQGESQDEEEEEEEAPAGTPTVCKNDRRGL